MKSQRDVYDKYLQVYAFRNLNVRSEEILKNGGGGGNRTRVRKPSDRPSTYIACIEKHVDPHRYNDNGACEDIQSHHFF